MALEYLPLTRDEMEMAGWNRPDAVLVTGDAYVDHPAFGSAVIGRVLENLGYRPALIAQPSWREPESLTRFGKPRLFFGVTAGNVDSLLSRYTAFKKVRNDDPYSPGGRGGMRPERAVLVYSNLIRAAYKDVPLIIGGIEASMRRFVHYDLWDNSVRRSILEDSRADLLVYGMGEGQVAEIARRLERGQSLSGIPGTAEITRTLPPGALILPSEEEVMADRAAFLEFYRLLYRNGHKILAQPAGRRYIVQYPPAETSREDLERIYSLPFSRKPHPSYGSDPIPAFEMIRDSLNAHRGCVSGCAFCSLALHQGRTIVSRSPESLLEEAERIAAGRDFRGHITDIGGPSANMYGAACRIGWKCARESCTYPELCPNLTLDTAGWVDILGRAEGIGRIKHVTVGSGIRYDLFMRDDPALLKDLARRHVSGQLKIAPEHTAPAVLRAMRKSPLCSLEDFRETFLSAARSAGKKLYIIPYFMSCHPGCRLTDMREMRSRVQALFRFVPQQAQAFIPLPMTVSSVIYYTGIDPASGEEFFVERDTAARRRQHEVLTKG